MFQFARREKTWALVEGGGVPSFIGISSSLEDVENGGVGRGGEE